VTTLVAPAKLTVSLRVTSVRNDGYHTIDAEMVSVDLVDELTFSAGDALSMAGPHATRVRLDDSNLVRRALHAVGRAASVHVLKRIPPGGGLGGGSTDAAAVLRWAGCDDIEVAAALGADVAFCVRGGRARATGVGDELTPLPFEPRAYTLLTPPFGCSTPAVYGMWDDMGGPTGAGDNDLEPAALAVEPRLVEWRDRLAHATGAQPSLAGSGSTWFVSGEHPGEGRLVVHTLPPHG
jgi:4-diphosphocytidyl-2-C-methyl-D-erythritol kinase